MGNILAVLRGLPCSGKSVYAARLVQQGYKRISAQDLRLSIDNGIYSESNEQYISEVIQTVAILALQNNYNIVLDSYNLANYWINWSKDIAKDFRADLKIINFDTPIDLCISRDLARTEGRIGKDNIMKMYNKYFINGIFPNENT